MAKEMPAMMMTSALGSLLVSPWRFVMLAQRM